MENIPGSAQSRNGDGKWAIEGHTKTRTPRHLSRLKKWLRGEDDVKSREEIAMKKGTSPRGQGICVRTAAMMFHADKPKGGEKRPPEGVPK